MSKSSYSLILLLSSNGGEVGDSISMSRPAFLSSSTSFGCSCSSGASVSGGLTLSEFNM